MKNYEFFLDMLQAGSEAAIGCAPWNRWLCVGGLSGGTDGGMWVGVEFVLLDAVFEVVRGVGCVSSV